MALIAQAVRQLAPAFAFGERRSTLSQPADWLREALIGPRTATGKAVTETTALTLPAVYACVSLIAETIASLPWPLYRRLSPRGKTRATEHRVYRLLHDAPNPEMTSFELREALVGHVETWGNAYAEIELDNAMRPIALWPLRPDRMLVERTGGQDRRLRYTYTLPSGRQFLLPSERVLHWKGLSPDGLVGYSRISLMREAVSLGLALEEYAARFFGNDSRPGGVLQHPGTLSDEAAQRLKASWESAHRGLDQAHRVAVLEEGVSWQQVGIPPQDAQFLEQRQFSRGDIAMIWRIPPHMIGDVERSTSWGSGIEQQAIGFVTYSLRSRLVRIETATNARLLTPQEQRTLFSEFLVDGLLRGDWKSRSDALAVMRQNGIINGNDWAEIENLNPPPDKLGEIYLVPLNMGPLEQVGGLVAPPVPPAPPALPAPVPEPESPTEDERAHATVEVQEVREYRCRKCRHLLFRSPEPRGRIETVCPDRRCRELQTVLLGT